MTDSTLISSAAAVVHPEDRSYDEARAAWNLAVDQRPAAVVTATTVEEVRSAVAYAAEHGLRVAPQTTGHHAAALGDLSGALLLRTALGGVDVDVSAQTARVGAGAVWADVVNAAAPHGLTALSGSAHDVGVVGYTTGGGMSWLARQYGYACDHVTAVELVTAAGDLLRVTAEAHPDLFWALRGGCGANFGVITAMEFKLFAIPEVFAGMTIWPAAQAADVLRAWTAWAEQAPDRVTTSLRFLRPPAMPGVPEPLQDTPVVVVDGAVVGATDEESAALVSAWRSVGTPMIDTWGPTPTAGLLPLHMDPPGPVPSRGDGFAVETLDDAGVQALLQAAQPEEVAPLLSVELRQLGGALGRPRVGSGAVQRRSGFGLFAVGMCPFPEAAAPIDARIDELRSALAPWSSGQVSPNFDERGDDAPSAFDAADLARLRAIASQVDPRGMFHASLRLAG
ncbi:MAG: FAD-binding oxidoreductase [Solirubrobacteraceae bacterium]|nr:FAD-binding oxidoreductase [Solirubrobacteraceae bacterium]